MADYTKTDSYLRLKEAKEKRFQRALKRKNSDTDVSAIPDDNWVGRYFIDLICRVGYHRSEIIYSRSEIKGPSIDLRSSLEMLFQEAACDTYNWTDAKRGYDDRRSFRALLWQLAPSGLEKYEPNTLSYSEASPGKYNDGSLSFSKLCHYAGRLLLEKILEDLDRANKCFHRCLSLEELMQRIRSESGDDFRREQAALLESFLHHLIKIQLEQRFVANSFSVHLDQLRMSAFSNPADDDGDMCPIILPKRTMDYCIWRQKHIFDSLCTMSRESVWLLKTLKDSPFSSPSSIKESNMILDLILAFISKFKKSKSTAKTMSSSCCFPS
ncbi:uncharacterized protein LOC113345442 isoform X2 [Papaver somniferum]|uniref:uncharacterized protein LOC113345442 isoform X2 n=1 Tax=Papaver somniferum TaxID=3469 RepID=UPI000E705ED8|nr:uncharacterized protein LOC113345442 isoform X2 [Papaver somniferum]